MAVIGLVHGIGGSAATMQPLADVLAARGHEVRVVTLPGHGTDPDHLAGVGWSDWLAAVPHAEVLVGQSMGATLVLSAAAADHGVRAVVAINPPVADEDVREGLEWRRSRGHEWIDAPDSAPGEKAYPRLPVAALLEMVEGALAVDLAGVGASVLLVTGALDDSTDPEAVDAMAAAIGGPVTRLVLPHSGHVATFGPDLDLLADAIDDIAC